MGQKARERVLRSRPGPRRLRISGPPQRSDWANRTTGARPTPPGDREPRSRGHKTPNLRLLALFIKWGGLLPGGPAAGPPPRNDADAAGPEVWEGGAAKSPRDAPGQGPGSAPLLSAPQAPTPPTHPPHARSGPPAPAALGLSPPQPRQAPPPPGPSIAAGSTPAASARPPAPGPAPGPDSSQPAAPGVCNISGPAELHPTVPGLLPDSVFPGASRARPPQAPPPVRAALGSPRDAAAAAAALHSLHCARAAAASQVLPGVSSRPARASSSVTDHVGGGSVPGRGSGLL